MKNTDKILVAIVGGIILLVVVAFAVTLARPKQGYLPDDTPEGVAQNYLLALLEKDYARAYGYLSPNLVGYPKTLEAFILDIEKNSWNYDYYSSVTLALQSVDVGENYATVRMLASQFRAGSLFDSGETTDIFDMQLRLIAGQWKISHSERYFSWCWNNLDRYGCP
jgi:hypothetical protein